MLRKLISCVSLLFTLGISSTGHASSEDQENQCNIQRIGASYQEFLHFAGSKATDCSSIEAKTYSLFAEHFRKTVNGQTVLERREDLGSYLWEFRNKLGRWKINPDAYPLIVSSDNSYVTVTYTVETTDQVDAVRLIVIAVLKLDSDQKLVEVFEVDHAIVENL